MTAILGDFPDLEIHRLDRVRRIDDLSDLGWEGQERGEPVPGPLPQVGQPHRVAEQVVAVELEQRVEVEEHAHAAYAHQHPPDDPVCDCHHGPPDRE